MLSTIACALAASTSPFGDLELVRALDALEHGDAADAFATLRPLLAAHPSAEVLFTAARAAIANHEPETALVFLAGLDEALPDIADHVQVMRARAHHRAGRWSLAQRAWESVLAESADASLAQEALRGLAEASLRAGDWVVAERTLRSTIEAAPRGPDALAARLALGNIDEQQMRYAEAMELYRYVAYRHPADPLGDVAEQRMLSLVTRSLVSPPSLSQQLAKIDAYIAQHAFDQAHDLLATLRAKSASERESLQLRQAILAFRLRQFPPAIKLFKALVQQNTDSRKLEMQGWLARTYSAAGRYADAIGVHLAIADEQPDTDTAKDALFKAAWLAYNGGDYRQAIKLYGQFIERYPDDSAVSDAVWFIGWNAYRLGDLGTAASTLRRLRREYASSTLVARAHYWEGRIAARLRQSERARQSFTAARDVDPLGYYGLIARQRLEELTRREPLYAAVALESGEHTATDALQPQPEDLPTNGGLRPISEQHLPWGNALFDWETAPGRRVVTLMRLGLPQATADAISALPALPGQPATEIAYARARLLWAVGDYHATYRTAARNFGALLKDLPTRVNKRYFQLAYPIAHPRTVESAANEFTVSPLLLLSVMRQESAFDDRARSGASAHGLMQIIPRTGRRIAQALAVSDYDARALVQPATNVRFGAWYLAQLLARFEGNVALAVGSYNCGPNAMSLWVEQRRRSETDEFVEDIPYSETRHYVRKVLSNLAMYHLLYAEKPLEVAWNLPETLVATVDF